MTAPTRPVLLAVTLLALGPALLACGGEGGDAQATDLATAPASTPVSTPATTPASTPATRAPSPLPAEPGRPAPVTVEVAGTATAVAAWAWCTGTVCADGRPPQQAGVAVDGASVVFSTAEPGWQFTATLVGADGCTTYDAPVTAVEGGWRVDAAGPAGEHRLDLLGTGPGGDSMTSLTWTTPADAPGTAEPTGTC